MATNSILTSALDDVRNKIAKAGSKGLGEQNTKATLINPVLRALGWNTEDIEDVFLEYRDKPTSKPVDYALLDLREPRLFIEAKALGENLIDHKWTNQIMGYAAVAGVEWVVLTDGNEYRIYNSHAVVPVEQKLLKSIRITNKDPDIEEILGLLSKDQLKTNAIDKLWHAYFVDRQVKAALDGLLGSDNDMVLVNYILKQTKNLSPEEVRSSLRRCNLGVEFPLTPHKISGTKAKVSPPKRLVGKLLEAGVLSAPLELSRAYKGQVLKAMIQEDGSVKCLGKLYQSLSLAASAARVSIIGMPKDGKLPPTNGWTFWKYHTSDGASHEIDHARQAFLNPKTAKKTGT